MDTANISQCPEVTVKCFLLSRFQSAIGQQGTLGEIPLNLIGCTILKNGQDAHSTRDEFSCGTGILPVPKQVIENGAIFPLNRSKDSARVLYVSAIALKLAKTWQQTPQTIAAQFAETLQPLCYPDFAVKVAPGGNY